MANSKEGEEKRTVKIEKGYTGPRPAPVSVPSEENSEPKRSIRIDFGYVGKRPDVTPVSETPQSSQEKPAEKE